MIAVEDEVFAQANEAQFGTFDTAKSAALKIKRQRKRTNSRSHSSEGDNDPVSPMSDDFPKLKLDRSFTRDRRSRTGSRGLPKKGGAGGKGTWGKVGDELNSSAVKDDQDPNFDATDMGTGIKLGAYIPALDGVEIEKNLKPLFTEYFENSELDECITAIIKFNIGPENIGDVLTLCVSMALEMNSSKRELCSRLIADMYGRVIEPQYMEDAFVALLKQIPDLELDNPSAADDIGRFLARAIADDCLPPAFLKRLASHDLHKKSQAAVLHASALLTLKFAMSKISNIWGVEGMEKQTTKFYTNKVWFILKEYLKSSELEEVKTSLRELDIPHFHHEVVYETIVLAMEQRVSEFEKYAQRMIDLLQYLGKTFIISKSQFETGFKRVVDDLDDLTFDIPNAVSLFSQFCDMCVAQSFMSDETYEMLHPNRGRKRFVSEGDGGKIKTTI